MDGSIRLQEGVLKGIIDENDSLSGVINPDAGLSASLQSSANLIGSMDSDATLTAFISNSTGSLEGLIRTDGELKGSLSLPIGYEDYTGEYVVTPKTIQQELATLDKHMNGDVIIKSIPYYEVDNPFNGQTVIIGDQ